jgi:hypothetical protein
MTTPLTRKGLEQAAFWGEAVCLHCHTVQTERAAGDDCQECEEPGTVPASVALNFIDDVEVDDE